MRLATLMMLAAASSALGLAACTQPAETTAAPVTPAATSGMQTAPAEGGITVQPGQVTPPPVGAYTGSQRGTNSPLGATYQVPGNLPSAPTPVPSVAPNSPLGFQRTPGGTPGSTPIIQPSPTQSQ